MESTPHNPIRSRADGRATTRNPAGNPDGADKPNKKYYDPRMCLRSAEEATVERLGAFRRLHQFFFADSDARRRLSEHPTHRFI